MVGTRAPIEIRPFTNDVIDDAARLLADRHRAQRRIEPGLSADYGNAATTQAAIASMVGSDGASGAVALRGGASSAI